MRAEISTITIDVMAHRIPFRYRSHDVSRLEAFSDVIFGFALSLIVISLEVPKTYDALMETMRGIVPFAFCFLIFIGLWFAHHEFFKRYALQDRITVFLNTVLLFVILFYVYPLKFMFVLMAEGIFGHDVRMPVEQAQTLFTIYGAGFATVNWLLVAMYWHAGRQADLLELNAVERLDTRESVYEYFWTGAFGILSIILAFTAIQFAGLIYFLLVIPKTAVPWIMGVKRNKLEDALSSPQTPGPGAPEDRPQHAERSGADGGGRRSEAVG
jgi:uncharacterized membrane protein